MLSGAATYSELHSFISLCHRIALFALRKRVRGGALHPAALGLSLGDIAFDCIATLFERSDDGRFRHLDLYFSSLRWTTLSDENLFASLRRLLFSRVNQELCKLWKQTDPSLEKLIRNLRIAVRSSRRLVEERVGTDAWVRLRDRPFSDSWLPAMSSEFLESHLIPLLRTGMTMRQVAKAVADVWTGQDSYRPAYPLTGLALAIRTAFVHAGVAARDVGLNEGPALSSGELCTLLGKNVADIELRMVPSYLGRGKVSTRIFAAYFLTVYDILEEEFVFGNGSGSSFFDHLVAYASDLTPEAYHQAHRCHLEYLVKIARESFLSDVRTLL